MKKLIMFVMVLMLCLGTAARAELVVSYDFNGTLESGQGGGDYPATMYEGSEAYDSSGAPPGGSAILLDGSSSVKLPIEAVNPFDGSADYSIAMWFKVPASPEGGVLISSARDDTEDNHSMAVFITPDGNIVLDYFYIAASASDTDGLDDGTWHHYALVYTAPDSWTVYIDGEDDTTEPTWTDGPDIPNIANDTVLIGSSLNTTFPAEDIGGNSYYEGSIAHVGIFDHALNAGEVSTAKNDGFPGYGPKNPIQVDPNASMLVYETNETESAFHVSLKFRPMGQGFGAPGPNNLGDTYNLTVLIDPNGGTGSGGNGDWGDPCAVPGSKDIILLDGAGADNQITLTFTPTTSLLYGPEPNCPERTEISGGTGTSCWDYPVRILFRAIDDVDIPEPPDLVEVTPIAVTMTSVVGEPNLNTNLEGVPWTAAANAQVRDNDQASILSVLPDGETLRISPYHVMEEPLAWKWGMLIEKIAEVRIRLQVVPKNDADPCTPLDAYVKVVMEKEVGEVENENPPIADPCLLPEGPVEPNAIVFTVDGNPVPGIVGGAVTKWDVPYIIEVKAVDDNKLQVEPGEDEGSQDYSATLNFFVESTSDKRYGHDEQQYDDQGAPIPGLFEWVAVEGSVPIDIQDNECGAFGLLPLDIAGNPNVVSDPNEPDCYLDMWDFLVIVNSWLDCDDPHDPVGCAPFPDPEEED